MSSRHGNRGDRNSGGDRDTKDQTRDNARRRDDDLRGRDNRLTYFWYYSS